MSLRPISHSETQTAMECQAKHAFAYTGHLTDGTVLKPKTTPIRLREGRAWGAGVAAYHATADVRNAKVRITAQLSLDAADQQQHGLYDETAHQELEEYLHSLVDHYAAGTERLQLDRLEAEILVAIPSRTGVRQSNRYRLQAFVDGIHVDAEDRLWIVEFKLRKQLTPLSALQLDRQIRWYAWAYQRATGDEVTGVIVDERLNQAPAPVKLNKDGTPSKVQSCRLDDYIAAWQELGHEPDEETVAKLAAKDWQQRHWLLFRPEEIAEAGREVVSAASLISMLDRAELWPVRNPSRMRCPGCAYKDACPDPGDTALVDALYDRDVPKRAREEAANAA